MTLCVLMNMLIKNNFFRRVWNWLKYSNECLTGIQDPSTWPNLAPWLVWNTWIINDLRSCGKGNGEELECLQRFGGRIMLKKAHLITQQIAANLDWDPLKMRKKSILCNLFESCLYRKAPKYSLDYFKHRNHDIHKLTTILETTTVWCQSSSFYFMK